MKGASFVADVRKERTSVNIKDFFYIRIIGEIRITIGIIIIAGIGTLLIRICVFRGSGIAGSVRVLCLVCIRIVSGLIRVFTFRIFVVL